MLPVYVGGVVVAGRLPDRACSSCRDIDNRTLAALVDPFGAARDRASSPLLDRRRAQHAPGSARRRAALEPRCSGSASRVGDLGALLLALLASPTRRPRRREARGKARPTRPTPRRRAAERSTIGRRAGASTRAATRLARSCRTAPGSTLRETVKNIYFVVLVLRRRAVPGLRQPTLGDRLRHQHLPGHLPGARPGLGQLRRSSCSSSPRSTPASWSGASATPASTRSPTALPTPTWLPFVAKLARADAACRRCCRSSCSCSAAWRSSSSRATRSFELGLYLYRPLRAAAAVDYWLICRAGARDALARRTTSTSATSSMVVYYVAAARSRARSASSTALPVRQRARRRSYSDMNGYGHFLPRVRAGSRPTGRRRRVLLLVVALAVLGARHAELGWRERWRIAARALARRRSRPAGARGGAGLRRRSAASSSTTRTCSTSTDTPARRRTRQADYEKRYKALAAEPQPKITAVTLDVDLFPREQRAAHARPLRAREQDRRSR